MTNPPAISPVVAELERIWNGVLRPRHAGLPHVMIVVASGVEGTKSKRWGHWAASRWADGEERHGEILIAGERLGHGGAGAFETLLHEAAHALAFARDIQDTSRQGRYHNERYRQLAGEVGLTCTKGQHGWNQTELHDATSKEYAHTIGQLDAVIRAHRSMPALAEGGEKKTGGGSRVALTCACAPKPRRIWAAASAEEEGPITCGMCGSPFENRAV